MPLYLGRSFFRGHTVLFSQQTLKENNSNNAITCFFLSATCYWLMA